MVTWQNYEEYMMTLVDGELSSHDEQELMAFVAKHPELKSELAAFNMVKLQPEADIVFENKEKLMKSVSTKRVIAFPVWQRYSIAAGVAAIIFISLFMFRPEEDKMVSVVGPQPVKTIAPAVTPVEKQSTPVVEDKTIVEPQAVAAVKQTTPVSKSNGFSMKKQVAVVKHEMIASVVRDEIYDAVPAAPRAINNNAPMAANLNSAPALALVGEIETQERKSLLDRLRIEEGKKEGIETVTAALTNTLDKVHSIKKDIDDRSLSVRIENKRLILSF